MTRSNQRLNPLDCASKAVWVLLYLSLVGCIAGCCSPRCASDPTKPVSGIRRLDHFALHVKDLEQSAAFYKRVFGFNVINKWRTTWMVGDDVIRVGLFLRPSATAVDDLDNRLVIDHVAFLLDAPSFQCAIEQLDQLGIKHDEPEDTGIAKSVFFRDPDGYNLEITTYYSHRPKP